MSTYCEVAEQIGRLVTEKNLAYGSAFKTAPEALKLLYPEGLEPPKYIDALLLVRIWDKMMRIATKKDAFGESPYRDIAGYGIIGASAGESGEPPPQCRICNGHGPLDEASRCPKCVGRARAWGALLTGEQKANRGELTEFLAAPANPALKDCRHSAQDWYVKDGQMHCTGCGSEEAAIATPIR